MIAGEIEKGSKQENSPLTSDERLVFLHIPKTGGTSLHEILRTNFRAEEICPERFNRLERWNHETLAKFRFYSGHFDKGGVECIPQKKRIITLFREPKSRILSLYYFWRSHRDEVIKKGNLLGPRTAKKMPLAEFLRNREDSVPQNIDNILTRTLLGKIFFGPKGEYRCSKSEVLQRVVEYIDEMDAIGVMEDFEQSVRHIVATLNLPVPDQIPHARDSRKVADPNLEPIEREPITAEVDAELERLTEMDQQVYEYARKRFHGIRQETMEHPQTPHISTSASGRTSIRANPPNPPNLTELADRFRSDKGTQTGATPHRYTYLYDLLFWPYREQSINLLELGHTRPNPNVGNPVKRKIVSPSVEMWLAYFSHAQILRFDVEDFSHLWSARFRSVQGDAGSEADLRRLAEAAPVFDVILDDASHAAYHQQLALKVLFAKLAPGGIYIMEDLQAQAPAFEEALPRVPRTGLFMSSYFEKGTYIDNPLMTAEDMCAIENELASYAAFPAFDGSASPTKLIVLRKAANASERN